MWRRSSSSLMRWPWRPWPCLPFCLLPSHFPAPCRALLRCLEPYSAAAVPSLALLPSHRYPRCRSHSAGMPAVPGDQPGRRGSSVQGVGTSYGSRVRGAASATAPPSTSVGDAARRWRLSCPSPRWPPPADATGAHTPCADLAARILPASRARVGSASWAPRSSPSVSGVTGAAPDTRPGRGGRGAESRLCATGRRGAPGRGVCGAGGWAIRDSPVRGTGRL